MKLFLKTSFLIAVILVTLILSHCCDKALPYSTRKDMKIRHGRANPLGIQDSLIIATEQSYCIAISFEYAYYSNNSRNGFFSESYANSCQHNGYKGVDASITKILIKSDGDFDNTHYADSVLNSYFQFPIHSFMNDSIPLPLDSVFKLYPNYMENLSEIYLELNKRPDIDTIHRFNITVELSNGKHFIQNSPVVIFKK